MKAKNILVLLMLAGCSQDKDGDGVLDEYDCQPDDASLYTSSTEVCDGRDNDCDGEIDEGVSTTYYRDLDGDGYGYEYEADSANAPVTECAPPDGYVEDNTDCDDNDADINPTAVEICDSIDNDCDNLIDDSDSVVDASTQNTYYQDADSDTYGNASSTMLACDLPSGYVLDSTDCNDDNYELNPGATETVDAENVDENCDGFIQCYYDGDGDGFGTTAAFEVEVIEGEDFAGCLTPGEADTTQQFINVTGDCDDTDEYTFPGAAENEQGELGTGCLKDRDMDGFGDVTPASSLVTAGTDCNDSDGTINPDFVETVADGIDSNCDENELCYTDSDLDQYGSQLEVLSTDYTCSESGLSTTSNDCDDADNLVYPGRSVNELDVTGDGVVDCTKDHDGDGYGDNDVAGSITPGTDCEDADANIHPGATEVCDTIDNDCDDLVDDADDNIDQSTQIEYFADADGDFYIPSTTSIFSCDDDVVGYIIIADALGEVGEDCNDSDSTVNPGASEVAANGQDDDCDGYEACYLDADYDGYGSTTLTYIDVSSTSTLCQDQGTSTTSTDCADLDADTFPGAAANDSTTDCMLDADYDGYGDSNPSDTNITAGSDCNDGDSAIRPNALEIAADDIDQNCDQFEDCYLDADEDGYGAEDGTIISSSNLFCTGENQSTNITDCNDLDNSIHPEAQEQCNEIDDDCDTFVDEEEDNPTGGITFYIDSDEDGYGSSKDTDDDGVADYAFSFCPTTTGTNTGDGDVVEIVDDTTTIFVVVPDGYSINGNDCNDLDPQVNPGFESELCDGVDNDCDGVIDGEICSATPISSNALMITGTQESQQAGYDIAIGDVNGDAIDDLILTSPYFTSGVASCSDSTFVSQSDCESNGQCSDSTSTTQEDCNTANETWTFHVWSADVHGAVYIFHGPISGDADISQADVSITGTAADLSGSQLGLGTKVVAADINGDDQDDLIIASPSNNIGKLYVIYNTPGSEFSSGSIADLADATIEGATLVDEQNNIESVATVGCDLHSPGDINNDGFEDVMIGICLGNADYSAGFSLLVYGGSTSTGTDLSGSYTFTDTGSGLDATVSNNQAVTSGLFVGETTADAFGSVVAGAGDVNADGLMDMLMGAPQTGTSRGTVYFIQGDETPFTDVNTINSNLIPNASHTGANQEDELSTSIGAAGDVNGDGYEDFYVGAHKSDTERGYVSFFAGTSVSLTNPMTEIATISGESSFDHFGISVVNIGDYNSDGFSDVLVSAEQEANHGAAYLFYGPLDGTIDLSTTDEAGGVILGTTMDTGLNSNFGSTMLIGDINNDNETDIIVSSGAHDVTNTADIGAVFLFTDITF